MLIHLLLCALFFFEIIFMPFIETRQLRVHRKALDERGERGKDLKTGLELGSL